MTKRKSIKNVEYINIFYTFLYYPTVKDGIITQNTS